MPRGGQRNVRFGSNRKSRPCGGMSASLIGPLGSSTFRLSTNAVSMSLAGSCFSSESAPGPLYGVFFVKELARAAKLSFVGFLVRSQSPFLRPDLRIADVDAQENLYKVGCHPNLAACFALARPYHDSFEHDGTLMRSR
jgi:hypothetical protein